MIDRYFTFNLESAYISVCMFDRNSVLTTQDKTLKSFEKQSEGRIWFYKLNFHASLTLRNFNY